MGLTWQKVLLILTAILVVGGTVTYTDLLGGLFQLKGVNYNYSGDILCEETCESFINVTTSYWRICFAGYDETKYENETLFKKMSRSRTLHVNLDNIDNVVSTEPRIEVDWMVPARGFGNWRLIKDGDCWERRGKVNKIKIVGHKEKSQTVKWGFNVDGYVEIDPVWIGIDKQKEEPKTQTIQARFTKTNVNCKIDPLYPIDCFNETCFRTLIPNETKLSKIAVSPKDLSLLSKKELPLSIRNIKTNVTYTKENIICHNKIVGIYKWGFNSSQVEVADLSVGVFNNTNSNTTAINVTLGLNGTYTSEVFALNDSYNSVNITADTLSWSGYEVEGAILTSANTSFNRINTSNTTNYLIYTHSQYSTYILDYALDDNPSTFSWIQKGGSTGQYWVLLGFSDKPRAVSRIEISHADVTNLTFELRGGDNCTIPTKDTYTTLYPNLLINNDSHPTQNTFYNSTIPNDKVQLYNCYAIFPTYSAGNWLKFNEIRLYEPDWIESDFKTFSNGVDTNNYSISPDSNFVQTKFKMYANSTDTSILYDFNLTFWNFTGAADIEVCDQEISSCSELSLDDSTYCLTQDIVDSSTSNCIDITGVNIVLDCQGYEVNGDDNADLGLYIDDGTEKIGNITIKNCTFTNWRSECVWIDQISNVWIYNSTIANCTNNSGNGIQYARGGNYLVDNVIFDRNQDGIRLWKAYNITIKNSNFTNQQQYGLMMDTANGNVTLYGNIFRNNSLASLDMDAVTGFIAYNNLFNDTNYINGATGTQAYFNITNQSGTRIFSSGNGIGGNYYTNATGDGFSDTCTDSDSDGYCDNNYNVSSQVSGSLACGDYVDCYVYSNKFGVVVSADVCSTNHLVNCSFPNNFVTNKTINMSCLCNTTSNSWCQFLNFTDANSNNYWNITENVNLSVMDWSVPETARIIMHDKVFLNISGY